jgi:hypothetical protein
MNYIFYEAYAISDCTNTYVSDGLLTYLGCKDDISTDCLTNTTSPTKTIYTFEVK